MTPDKFDPVSTRVRDTATSPTSGRDRLRPAQFKGRAIPHRYLTEDGRIVRIDHRTGQLVEQPTNISGTSPYPRLTWRSQGRTCAAYAHQVVCETFHPFPRPRGVTDGEWRRTPASVKTLIRSLYQVNHIDHDKTNYHPRNLEWVTAQENQQKYQARERSLDGPSAEAR